MDFLVCCGYRRTSLSVFIGLLIFIQISIKVHNHARGGHVRIFNRIYLQRTIESFGWKLSSRHSAHALHSPYWWLKCFYYGQEDNFFIKKYQKFLEWQILSRPKWLNFIDNILNPIFGKSVVMYFDRNLDENKQPDEDAQTGSPVATTN